MASNEQTPQVFKIKVKPSWNLTQVAKTEGTNLLAPELFF
jgi:hypothetical protein